MNALINRQLIDQVTWDSGALRGLSLVVQQFTQPGRYHMTLLQGDQPVRQEALLVRQEAGERPHPQPVTAGDLAAAAMTPGAPDAIQRMPEPLFVDLAQLRPGLAQELPTPLALSAQAYAVFHASAGMDGLAVIAEPAADESDLPPFDSRRLDSGSVFAVTLIRPGTYRVTNVLNGTQGRIVVAYPTVGKTAYRPPEPYTVTCSANGFDSAAIDLQPAQGVIFQISVPARITVELVEPDDGPAEPRIAQRERAAVARWRKP